MKKNLTIALEALKVARLSFKRPSAQRKVLLFPDPGTDGLEFNGFNTLSSYGTHLHSLYVNFKRELDAQVNARATEDCMELVRELNLLHYEIKSFRRGYFPKGKPGERLERVEIVKGPVMGQQENSVRITVARYLDEQFKTVRMLDKLFDHRIQHLITFFGEKGNVKQKSKPPRAQLALFPQDSSVPLLRWKGTKVEFAELFYSLYESGVIVLLTTGQPTREDFFAFFQWALNIHIGNIRPIINNAQKRKVEVAPFLVALREVFKGGNYLRH